MFSIVADANCKECLGHNPAAAKANGAAVYICIVCTTAAVGRPLETCSSSLCQCNDSYEHARCEVDPARHPSVEPTNWIQLDVRQCGIMVCIRVAAARRLISGSVATCILVCILY